MEREGVVYEMAASEDGLLEQLQNILLLLATLVFAIRAYRSHTVDRAICVGAALLCILFFFREAEFPPDAPFAAYLSSRAFRWHEALVIFAIVVPYAALRWRLAPYLIRYVASRQAWPFYLAAILLVIGYWFDKFGSRYMDLYASRFWEELAESVAYCLLVLAAFLPLSDAGAGRKED